MAGNKTEILSINLMATDAVGDKLDFTSVESLSSFLEKELQYWGVECGKYNRNETLAKIRNSFQSSQSVFANLVSKYPNTPEPNRTSFQKQQINAITGELRSTLFSTNPASGKLLDACKLGETQAATFWNIVNKTSPAFQIRNYAEFEGTLLAYEYLRQSDTDILTRRNSEERALSDLRKSLSDATDKAISESIKLLSGISTDADKLKSDMQSDFTGHKNEVNKWKAQESINYETQRTEREAQRETFFADADKKVKELETLYSDKLKLEKPAQYWDERAKALRKSGIKWTWLLVVSTVAILVLFAFLFKTLIISNEDIGPFSVKHWQGIILLLTILSLVAFLLRTFGKLAFSAFHLQRDAEEREKLAYVYLALIKETGSSDEERRIILQSLFSRSDSGLLSGDHGPKMPTATTAAEILKKNGQ